MTLRCTNATVAAFGCPSDETLFFGTSVLGHLNRSGFQFEPLEGVTTVGAFMKANPTGMFYLSTAAKSYGHAMALVDGVLTDTAEGGMKRKVYAFRVTKK